jgi:hypothetical protein
MLSAQAVTDAATRLTNAGGGPDALIDVDFGTVAPDLAAAAGYSCLTNIDVTGS